MAGAARMIMYDGLVAETQVAADSAQPRRHDPSLYVKRPRPGLTTTQDRSSGSALKLRPVRRHQMGDRAIDTVPPKSTGGRREAALELSAAEIARDIGILAPPNKVSQNFNTPT
jgi:hypothetical protein